LGHYGAWNSFHTAFCNALHFLEIACAGGQFVGILFTTSLASGSVKQGHGAVFVMMALTGQVDANGMLQPTGLPVMESP
jgi:hypothetical protein